MKKPKKTAAWCFLARILLPILLFSLFMVAQPASAGPVIAPNAPAASADCNIWWGEILHNTFDSVYRSPFGATTPSGAVRLRLRVAQSDITSARVRVWDDRANTQTYYNMSWDGSYDTDPTTYDWWVANIPTGSQPTILYYFFEINDAPGSCTADQDFYVDDDVKFYGGGAGTVSDNYDDSRSFQITIYDPAFTSSDWMKNAVIYQIFPERFRNGDTTNDPVNGTDWIYGQTVNKRTWSAGLCDPRGDCPGEWGNQFTGGDLQGIIDNLDYLQEMGVTGIYLNPIFEAPSNHLYDAQDYLLVDPYFGDLADFQTLASEAEDRGIKLILDGVFNHVTSDSKYFDRYSRFDAAGNMTSPSGPGANDLSGACEGTSSSWRSWFTFVAGPPNKCYDGAPGSMTLSYWDWAGFDSLAKLNSSNADVRNYIYASGSSSVARYWLVQGADGWRFDVGGDVSGGSGAGDSNGFWEGYRTAALTENPDAVLLGEEWGDATAWLVGEQWDSVMNYRFRSAVLSWMFDSCSGNGCTGGTLFEDNDSNNSSSSGPISLIRIDNFDDRLKSIREDYPAPAWYTMMNLMGSHDTNRVLFLLKKISNDDANVAKNKFKFLGLFMFTYPGAPTIYYGDEVGLATDGMWVNPCDPGSCWKYEDDPYNRQPYPWADEGLSPDAALQAHFRKLAVLRDQYPVLRTGDLTDSARHNTNRTYAYARTTGASDIAVILLNRNPGSSQNVTMSGINAAFDGTILYDVLNCSGSPVVCPSYTITGGSVTVNNIPALWGSILVEGPLPSIGVTLSVTDDDIPAGGSTSLVATVTNLGGELAPDGTTVNFTQLDGTGSLSSGTAVVSGGAGQASITYNAPSSGSTVATIKASAGSYAGAAATGAVLVGYPVNVSAQASQRMTIGPATLDATGAVDVWVSKTGNGEPTVTVAKFAGNPAGGVDPYQGSVNTPYVDVHLSGTSDVTQIEIRVDCNGTCSGDERLWWWDAVNSRWSAFSTLNSGQSGGASGYVWGRVTATSSPSLSDLTGTAIVGGNPSPTVVEVETVENGNSPATWPMAAAAALALLGGLAAAFVIVRKRRA